VNIFRINKKILLILLPLLLFSCKSKKEKIVIAKIKSHQIYLSDFVKRYKEFLSSTGIKDNLNMRYGVINNMVNEIILYYYDNNNKIFNNPEYKKEQAWNKKEAVLNFLKDREIYKKINVTEKEIREAYYRAHVSIAAKHLFARTKEEADNLYKLLKAGANFDLLAKQVFTDSTLRNNGGYLGYFTWGDMDPAFENAAFNLRVGEISRPVKTAYGYSIIKVVDRKEIPLMTENDFLNRRDKLLRSIAISKKLPAERKYISKIFDRNALTFSNNALQILLKKLKGNNKVVIADLEKNKLRDTLCAQYKKIKFSVNELLKKLKGIPFFHRRKIKNIRLLKSAIEALLIQELLYKIALDKDYDKAPEVEHTFKELSIDTFLKYKMNEIASNSTPKNKEVMNFYKRNISMFAEPRKITIQEIIVKEKPLAYRLFKKLKRGISFALLAKKYSIRKWSAKNKGIIGPAKLSQFGYLKNKFWSAPLHKLIGPINVSGYWGIFRVLKKIKSRPIPFNKIKDDVITKLKLTRKNQLVMKYLKKKREKIKVWIDSTKVRFTHIAP